MSKSSRVKKCVYDRRVRLFISLALGIIVFFATRADFSSIVCFMFSWIAFAISNVAFSWIFIISFHPRDVKVFANKEDSSGRFIFFFVVVAAFISLVAIILLLQSMPDTSKQGLRFHIVLAFSSVFCSWILIHTLFTLRYAHLFYKQKTIVHGQQQAVLPLGFPSENDPDYLDFAYFSFVIGMTFQVSDVTINSREIRRLALLHGFLAFIYNTVIVAFSINIVSGLFAR